MVFKGKVFKYGDNVDTDVIIPARYLNSADPENLAAHCMEDIDEDFADEVSEGDIIVGGKNFGSGSSREHAPLAIKYAGVSCVVAESFARIFYRNSINIGLPILECPAAVQATETGDQLEVNIDQGQVKNLRTGKTYQAVAFPPFMQEIIKDGGLIEHVKKELV
ncbi:3-isopropylmalate/(R)-2-methylmalate dehydratase small subunit [Halanaerobium saccharolyticum]|uniref:3-isopropylmalate dehydratase small subunit n=1 Tax=Halanaerobium saccharolyticum TaxID=43595 RepID=A0A4R6LU89_9FIRM|nr:3-isopropylmalate dehydratase small subunit [Halanaerobium saccharolyticum]TDO92268.1 3-isopropylmalate/(R)-2-methylmalate dehydratase small subunit [Halanaerobium saccharolyticum]